MSIVQFWRIITARIWVVLALTASCVLGAFLVTILVPPRWEAHSRVLLNLLKPDPVTGQIIAATATRAYVNTQIELITDYGVAGQAARDLGWLSDPVLIRDYRQRPKDDGRDFTRYVAQLIIDRTRVEVVEGSNILEITYIGTTPDTARSVANALRKAYIDASLSFRREEANRNADWFVTQADKAKAALDAAEAAKTAFERENGVVLDSDKFDIESARLRALATELPARLDENPTPTQTVSPASAQLAEVDAQIAQTSQLLGPNHPDLLALRAKREALAAVVAADKATVPPTRVAANPATARIQALDRAVQEQKSLVIAQRDKLGTLARMQADVDLRRDQYNKTAARAADLRREAGVADAGLTALGAATTPQSPAFPNKPLIYFGSVGLGLAMGILMALLQEFLNRRVRGIEDLQTALDVPVLAVISTRSSRRIKRPSRRQQREQAAGQRNMLRA